MKVRSFLKLAAATIASGALSCGAPLARAQSFPSGPITWVVGYSAGAATDVLTRQLASAVGRQLGQSVVVENLAGAGSTVAAAQVARRRADGHQLITLDVAGLAINPAVQSGLTYDANKSFTPISLTSRIPFVLVTHAKSGPRNFAEFSSRARTKPQALTYASAGTGSAIHMAMALLESHLDARLTHVPYKGAAPALNDVLAGRVDVMFISLGAAMPHLKAGSLRALGASGDRRFASLPDVATLAELGVKGYEASAWQGVLAPAGLPQPVLDRLVQSVHAGLADPKVRETFEKMGSTVESSSPQQFADYIRSESAKWTRLVRERGIKVEPGA